MRRLIVNADDLGLTEGVNRAISEGHARGIITSTTLMANSVAFESAVKLARETPTLSVGCHVVLVDGLPVEDPSRIKSLLDSTNAFRPSVLKFARDAYLGRLDPEHIYLEAKAQFRKLMMAGITPTHFDTHKHTHMFPGVLQPLLRAARDCGIVAVRNPFVPPKPLMLTQLASRPKLWVRYAETRFLRAYHSTFQRAVADAGLTSPDGSFGIVVTGVLDMNLFHAIAECIPKGTWEFVCHPGYIDSQLNATRTRLRRSREIELELLVSEESRIELGRRGVELISYRDFLRQDVLASV